jgi:hypothetical protein
MSERSIKIRERLFEIWKDIPGFEGIYKISNLGKIISLKHNKNIIIKPINTKSKYNCVNLYLFGKRNTIKIHRLVAGTFIQNPENKPCVNHKNGIKTDNNVDNLEWVSYLENNVHALKTRLRINKSGESHPNSKLNFEKVSEIRSKYESGLFTLLNLANEYGVGFKNISKIVNNKTWKQIDKVEFIIDNE